MKHVIAGLALLAWPHTALAAPMDVSGLWQTESGGAHINIADCGDGTPCGTLVWLNPAENAGAVDAQNPDEALRDTPLIGLKMLWGFKVKKEGWKSGKIYDPESGKTYGSRLKVSDDGILRVKGCIGPICQTQKWSRVTQSGSVSAAGQE